MNFLLILYLVATSNGLTSEVEASRLLVRISSPQACAVYAAEKAREYAARHPSPYQVVARCFELKEPA